jgi:hypothetical protein
VQLNNSSSFKLINEISVKDDFVKFFKMLQTNYSKAPFFNETMAVIEAALAFDRDNLAAFLGGTVSLVCKYLGVGTKLIYASDLTDGGGLKGKDRVLDICKQRGASVYVNAAGGKELYDKAAFADNGVTLYFINSNLPVYKQLKNEFIPGLSIIDVMMFNSADRIREMLCDYTLE